MSLPNAQGVIVVTSTVVEPLGEPASAATTRRRRHLGPVFWLALGWVTLMVLAAIVSNVLPIPSPTKVGVTEPGAGPSLSHLLGGDQIGRDELSRIIYGSRVSLGVSFSAIIVGLAIALPLGMMAGFFGGTVDAVITFVADTLFAFPGLVIALVIITFVGPHVYVIVASLALGALAPGIRVFRAVTSAWAQADFVRASRLLGARSGRLLFREILPNMMATTIAYALIAVSVVISLEAVLSFVGVSVRPPAASWGNMIAGGTNYLQQSPSLVVWPSLVLFVTILSFNLLADRLQSVFDVREGRL